MFSNDHPPPRFHARYGEFEATIGIETLEVIEGQLPGRALNLVREWAMMPRESRCLRTGGSAGRKRRRPGLSLCREWSLVRWDIVEVKPEPDYGLFVRFKDGLSGRVQLRPEELTGALAPLRDVQFFEQVHIDCGAVAWPGEIDLAPDSMYAEVACQPQELQQGRGAAATGFRRDAKV